jgi:hypothetical protein
MEPQQSYWSNSKYSSVVVRFATFRAGDIGVMFSRLFDFMFCHLFGVMLSHLLKEGFEDMAATFARQVKACLPAIRSNLPFLLQL